MEKKKTSQCKEACGKRSWHPVCGFGSEKGVVLVVVLVLAAVVLTLMTTLIYMITTGTQISGFEKRYKTALEASQGGADLFYQVIAKRGESTGQTTFLSNVNSLGGLNAIVPDNSATCSATVDSVTNYSLAAKLLAPTTAWTGCNRNVAIDPNDPTTYDMQLDLGTTTKYRVFAKITATSEGNSSGDEDLMTQGVVSANTGEVTVMSRPYLYAIEIDAENVSDPQERAKLSILYQY